MLIVPIIVLALILVLLLLASASRQRPAQTAQSRRRDDNGRDGLIHGGTPDGVLRDGPLPDDFTPGGGDFGGAGASGEWDSDSDGGGDSGGDGGGD